jgi:hypothetical protein
MLLRMKCGDAPKPIGVPKMAKDARDALHSCV